MASDKHLTAVRFIPHTNNILVGASPSTGAPELELWRVVDSEVVYLGSVSHSFDSAITTIRVTDDNQYILVRTFTSSISLFSINDFAAISSSTVFIRSFGSQDLEHSYCAHLELLDNNHFIVASRLPTDSIRVVNIETGSVVCSIPNIIFPVPEKNKGNFSSPGLIPYFHSWEFGAIAVCPNKTSITDGASHPQGQWVCVGDSHGFVVLFLLRSEWLTEFSSITPQDMSPYQFVQPYLKTNSGITSLAIVQSPSGKLHVSAAGESGLVTTIKLVRKSTSETTKSSSNDTEMEKARETKQDDDMTGDDVTKKEEIDNFIFKSFSTIKMSHPLTTESLVPSLIYISPVAKNSNINQEENNIINGTPVSKSVQPHLFAVCNRKEFDYLRLDGINQLTEPLYHVRTCCDDASEVTTAVVQHESPINGVDYNSNSLVTVSADGEIKVTKNPLGNLSAIPKQLITIFHSIAHNSPNVVKQ